MKARSKTAITIKTTKSSSRPKPVRSFPRMNKTITDNARNTPAAATSGTRAFKGEMLRRRNQGPPKPVMANTAKKTKTGYHPTDHLYPESAPLSHIYCDVNRTGSVAPPFAGLVTLGSRWAGSQIVFILASATGRPSGSATTTNRPHVASWVGQRIGTPARLASSSHASGSSTLKRTDAAPAVVPAGKIPLSS